jgi:histidinol phosphatase-like enzyme (inositol monophosphatase family)
MSPRLAFALRTASEAARATLPHFRAQVAYELKEDETPVTVADKEAEQAIRAAIEREYPGEMVLGEEQGGDDAPDRWVVDPIDGTKSFICGVPLYATLLSYEQGGEPVLGVCVLPALGDVLYAEKGAGCFLNDRPCRVSRRSSLERAVVSSGGHLSMVKAGRMDAYLRLAEDVLATRTWSDAYGHALVASGRIEAMVDPVVNRWDVSAMAVIVREAGGSFTDFFGGQALADEALSCAPGIKDALLEAFAR